MTDFCIETQDLCKQFDSKDALQNVSLQLRKGCVHALIGSNGSGKTTLFRILLGLDGFNSGFAKILGHDCAKLIPDIRSEIGYVTHDHALPEWMRVVDIMRMQRDCYPNWQQHVYENTIAWFNVQAKQKVSALSRGERAGVSLSLALAQNPQLLILDEPTTGLDIAATNHFIEALLIAEQKSGRSIVYCSHAPNEIERVADNLVVLEQGKVLHTGDADSLTTRVSNLAVNFTQNPTEFSNLTNLLTQKQIDGSYHMTFIDPEIEQLKGQLTAMGATSIQHLPVTLESAVNAIFGKSHQYIQDWS